VRSFSPEWSQHIAHIAPGRDGLFNLIRSLPSALRYENQLIVAEEDYVIAHGRCFSGNGRPTAWIAADVVRFDDGKLAEHWDVLQDEATVDFRILWPQFQQLMSKISGLRANSL
jgi:predicted SnoaL-like aldol condensation-catalyzing enzyme